MSIVLVAAMSNFALLMSDGRVSNKTLGVAQEDYKKLLRVSENICIGFTGHQKGCEETISVLKNDMCYMDIVNSLHKKAQEVHSVYSDKMIMCVVGFNEDGNMSVYYFSSDDFILKPYHPKKGKVSLVSLEPIPTTIYVDNCNSSTVKSLDDYCRLMYKTISDVSKINPTVNNFTFSELITDTFFYGGR